MRFLTRGRSSGIIVCIMLRKVDFAPDCYYHIYNRGTDKRNIFLKNSDYLRFIVLLYICNNTEPVRIKDLLSRGRSLGDILEIKREKTLVDIGVYCLIPNHFHLLVREKQDNGISVFLKKLSTGYAMYVNKKNERSGNLFQGRFKAELADKDEYLKYLFAYIHLNPVKLIEPFWKERGIKDIKKAKEFLANYKWSSYQAYIDEKKVNPILEKSVFPEYFGSPREFTNFIQDWLDYQLYRPEDGPWVGA